MAKVRPSLTLQVPRQIDSSIIAENVAPEDKPKFTLQTEVNMIPHSFDQDYMVLIPPDETQIWYTQITFTLQPEEQVTEGIKK